MAYVSGYKWDVFVSYARIDDAPLVEGEKGWVTTLVDALMVGVRFYLGEEIKLFFDLDEAGPGTNELEDLKRAAAASALMVVIASPAYCRREWTMAELDTFLGTCPDKHRLFAVERLPLPPGEAWPDALERKIRYPFHEPLPRGKAKVPLTPATGSKYHLAVMDLAHRIQEQLRSLPSANASGPDEAMIRIIPEAQLEAAEPKAFFQPPASAPPRRTILLARGSHDVADDLDSVRRFLGQYKESVAVVPEVPYSEEAGTFLKSFETDLASADIFVQLLGADSPGAVAGFPEGYARYQLDRAKAAGKTILQWRRPDLDWAKIADDDYRSMVGASEVMPVGLEEFKRHIRGCAGRAEPEPPVCHEKRVFITADRANLMTAEAIASEFEAEDFEPKLPRFDGSARENREHLYKMMAEAGIVMVVNAIRPPIWFDNQRKVFEFIKGRRAVAPQGLAVCSVPPAVDLEPETLGGEFVHIDCTDGFDPARLRDYISSLKRHAAPAPQPAN
jgi:hypothetical protein